MSDVERLRRDALAIWQAGVDAVRSERLVAEAIECDGRTLSVCGETFDLSTVGRIAVVGAGKAGAGMAAAVEEALGPEVLDAKVTGWVNVPADCVRELRTIRLHAGRPAGVNEPTAEGVAGTEEILRIVGSLGDADLCLVLISGGGSALLPAPKPPVTLADKQEITRRLMHAGATIQELNAVRKRLSQVKGGGLARACRAGRTIALIISDVIGDPLDFIASGPTYPDTTTDAEAVAILRAHLGNDIPANVLTLLESGAGETPDVFPHERVTNRIVGCNAKAVEAAATEATGRGYEVISLGSENAGEANEEGRQLWERCRSLRENRAGHPRPVCVLSGGEPVVQLAKTDRPRKGGRNQQLVLAGLVAGAEDGLRDVVLLSGGTDGEDGPTDAAGAYADAGILAEAARQGLDAESHLAINDAYTFFEQAGGLIVSGPTHTNVMDLRVALVGQE